MKRLLLLVPVFLLSACVYVQHTHVRNKGAEIDKQQMAMIEPGKTDKAWILRNIGTPDRIEADTSGLEVYEYVNERTEHSHHRFILLFSVDKNKVIERHVTRVTLRSGIVESVTTKAST